MHLLHSSAAGHPVAERPRKIAGVCERLTDEKFLRYEPQEEVFITYTDRKYSSIVVACKGRKNFSDVYL
jgi:hypothetical protein